MTNINATEKGFKEQTRYISNLIKDVSQPMIVTTSDLRLLLWNAAFTKLIGYSNKELSNPIISAGLTAPEWQDIESKALDKLQRTGKSQTFQKEYIHKDGSRVPVEILIYRLTEGNGKVQYYIGLIADITERKRLEEALQKSERHYRVLVDNAIEGVVVIQDGAIKFVNPIVAMATGYSVEEILSMSLNDILSPDNDKAAVESISRAVAPGTLLVVPLVKIRTKAGGIRLIESTVVSIIWDDEPANLNLLRDITERHEAELMLKESENRYSSILEDISEGYWEVDLAGNFISFNNAICRLVGYSAKEMAGMNYRIYTSATDVEKVYKAFNQVYRTGKPIRNMQYEIVRKDGSRRFAETSVFSRQNDQAEIVGFRGVSHDITNRRKIEESLEKERAEFKLIIDSSPIILFYKDSDGKFIRVNKAFTDALQMPEEQFLGKTVFDLYSNEIAQAMTDDDQEVLKSERPKLNIIEEYESASGIRWVQTDKVPIFDQNGTVVGLVGFSQDITERKQMEEALRLSEERYRTILDEMQDNYWEVDLAGNYIYVNDANCHSLGYSREELIGMNYRTITASEDVDTIYETFNQIYQTGQPSNSITLKFVRKDGNLAIGELKAVPLKNERGEIIGFRGLSRDITKHIQAETALRYSEEKYRTLLDDMQNAYFEIDLAGNYTFGNDSLYRYFGYSPGELKGTNYRAVTAPDDIEMLYQKFNQIYQTGEPINNIVYKNIRKDGSIGHVEITVSLLRDEKGEITGFKGVGRDITQRKQMEEALRQSEEKYRSILESIEESYYEVDLAGNLTFFNESLRRGLGYSREELMGMNYKVYTPVDEVERISQTYNQIYRTGESLTSFPVEQIRKDGTRLFVDLSVSPILNEKGKITGFRGVGRDISERLKMEEALRQSEEKYRTVLDEMEEGYYETDLEGNYTFFNDVICKKLGYSREELMGKNFQIHTRPEDVNTIYEAYFGLYRSGKTLKWYAPPQIRKDGAIIYTDDSVSALRNKEGQIIGYRGISRDITERKQMEEALERSEERYRTIMDEIHDDYFENDLAGNYTFVNDAFCRSVGYKAEELIGKSYKLTTAAENAKKIYAAFNNIYRTGDPVKALDITFLRKDGTSGFAELSAFPVRNDKGEIIGFRGVSHDITERKQMEEALKQSEKRYRTILEDMQESYFEVDLEGNYILFNDAQCRQLGYTREEMNGLNYKAITPPDRQKEVFEIYNRIYRTGEPNNLFHAEQIKKDGTRIPVEYSAFPIKNEEGEIVGFRGVGRDISTRVQMEKALRSSEERYRTVLNDMEEAYYEEDLAGNLTFFNEALCRQLGYSREELSGMSYKVYTVPEEVPRVFEAYNRVYTTGQPLKAFPIERVRKDGKHIFAETSAFPLHDEAGQIIGYRGVIRDISERIKAEEERRELEQKAQFASRLASVGELASGVAHEINNPLTGVIGYAHLLLNRKELSRDVRHDLEIINEGAQRVSNIVKKLLTFARQTKPEQRYVDVNELIRNTLELRAYELSANNIKVTLQLTRDMPLTIADPGQLQQVFLNLIINAETEMKLASDKGKLTIKTERINNIIRITFKDTGPGIPEQNLETIFDPFFTTREVGQGTGLGLSVCHGIITEHNGKIWAESEPGKGAAFIIELPLTGEGGEIEPSEPAIQEPAKVSKAKILVVDDEPVIRQFMRQVLGEQGHTVETVDNAASALKMVKAKRYRLILLDIKMPGMSGVELYKEFQKIAPSLTKRVIFITGDVMGKRTISFLNKTKTPYMMKPFDAKELKTEINRILAKR